MVPFSTLLDPPPFGGREAKESNDEEAITVTIAKLAFREVGYVTAFTCVFRQNALLRVWAADAIA